MRPVAVIGGVCQSASEGAVGGEKEACEALDGEGHLQGEEDVETKKEFEREILKRES